VFTLARSAGRYEGSLRQVIHAFKYEGRRVLAQPLADLMKAAGEPVLAGADAVVPVPLHPWRALQRGFNQADDLARALGLPVWRVLARTRHGPPQAGLPASRRHANVRRAYAIRTPMLVPPFGVWLDGPAKRLLKNRVVVLVDDVMTTGATLDACGRLLIAAGVRSVRALTAARAVVRPPSPRPPQRRQDAARH
jgi:ComF family protein